MGVWGQRRWTTCDLYPFNSHRLVAVILAKSSSRSTRDGQTTPSISEKVWTHPKTDVPPGEVLSKHHLRVLINFPSPFLCWVQHGKANALSSLISPVKKLSSNFPPFWIWPKLLSWEVPTETTHSWTLAFLSSAWHMSQSRGCWREKISWDQSPHCALLGCRERVRWKPKAGVRLPTTCFFLPDLLMGSPDSTPPCTQRAHKFCFMVYIWDRPAIGSGCHCLWFGTISCNWSLLEIKFPSWGWSPG